ncbi:hypothetical protein FPCIR_11840 [Fusarium pseudocircinatum]|uniref:Uncharacterized protein n=1 Tax=Fusarium pseudocircinatum TaxID=56676 RepID=A0A8H5KR59_9HYPO|nr:hypothetical protein FPCIR_11840 [Fusarium pseudocircinatum]
MVTLDRIFAAVEATNAHMGDMETRFTNRIDTSEQGMNNRFNKLEGFATNNKAHELGVPYTPLVKENGAAIRNLPRTFAEVNALNVIIVFNFSDLRSFADSRLATLLHAVGAEVEDGYNLAPKLSAFLGAIGVMQSPNL